MSNQNENPIQDPTVNNSKQASAEHHDEDHGHGFFYPFVFPFYQKNYLPKIWWIPVLALVPILNLILLQGWRFALVSRMTAHKEQILPDADIGLFIRKGAVLWMMTSFYVIIPTIIIFSVGAGELGSLFRGLGCFWTWIFGDNTSPPLHTCLANEADTMIVRLIIEFIWLIVQGTLFKVALIRYAISGKKRVFLSLAVNAGIALYHIKTIVMMIVFGLVMSALFLLATSMMLATVVLTPFIPLILLVVYYYATGYEYGHLGHDITSFRKKKAVIEGTA